MAEETRTIVCLGCDGPVLPGLDVCLACGGRSLYQSLQDGEYAVEAGPISSQRFRDDAVKLLGRVLERELSPERIQRLADERVRVCQNLDQPVAEALARRLGRQEASAQVVRGPAPERGATGGFAKPWPWLSAVVGLALFPFVGWWTALLGIAAAVGFAISARKERMAVLGDAPVPPEAWATWVPVARRAAALLGTLDGAARERFAAVTTAVRDALVRLGQEDGLAIAAGGRNGAMGRAVVQLLEEAVLAAECWRDAKDTAAADALARYAETASKARTDVLALGRSLEAGPRMTAEVEREVETLTDRVRELKRVWSR